MRSFVSIRGRCLETLDVFILAGGLGTRIRPVLGDVPKILAPISGRPFLAYLFDWLLCFGARRMVLGLGHKAEAVIDYMTAHPIAQVELVTVVEPSPLGTAGAIRYAREVLRSDPVLIMNGDSFTDANLCAFVGHHYLSRAIGSLLCAEVSDAGRYGRLTIDKHGRVGGFIEKDAAFPGTALINAGIYLLSAPLLDDIASGDAVSLERDIFEHLPSGSLAAFAGRFPFIDIGTPESFAAAPGVFGAGGQLESWRS